MIVTERVWIKLDTGEIYDHKKLVQLAISMNITTGDVVIKLLNETL